MIFSTYEFLFVFLPLAFATYFVLSRFASATAAKWGIAAASFLFYWRGTGSFVAIFALLVSVNFAVGTALGTLPSGMPRWKSRMLLGLGLLADIAVLGYFKYVDFFVSNINTVLGARVPLLGVALPIGISFFTFQLVAYLVDSYEGKTRGYGFVDYLVFIAFFPQLIVGPIVHHTDVVPQFRDPRRQAINPANIAVGLSLITMGLAKKVVFADPLTDWAASGFLIGFSDAGTAWLQATTYTAAYYYDLSGYADMAVGLGKVFNIDLPWNFNSPYKARNFAEYWRRWHITLSRFLGDYVFRSVFKKGDGPGRFYWAVFVTFLVSGFWHGAGWNFVVWGVFNGVFVMTSHGMKRAGIALPFLIAWGLTFTGVILSWVLFVSPDLTFAIDAFRVMADLNTVEPIALARKHANQIFWLAGALGVAFFAPNTLAIIQRFRPNWVWGVAVTVTLLACTLAMNKVSDFLYFQF